MELLVLDSAVTALMKCMAVTVSLRCVAVTVFWKCGIFLDCVTAVKLRVHLLVYRSTVVHTWRYWMTLVLEMRSSRHLLCLNERRPVAGLHSLRVELPASVC